VPINQIASIFCEVDDFCKELDGYVGNVNDVKAPYPLLSKLKGLAFGDKGYIGKKLSEEEVMECALKLITRTRENMKDTELINALKKQLLNQRCIIETVFDHLKHHYQI
jgi:hypothetical protein